MNAAFQTTLAVLAGACFYGAVHYAWLGARKPRNTLYLLFALLNLLVGFYTLSKLGAYHAESVTELVALRRIDVTAAILFFAALPWFIATYLQKQNHPLSTLISLIWLPVLLANQLLPYGLNYTTLPELSFITLPWGEQIVDLRPHLGAILTPVFSLIFINFAWYGYLCVQEHRRNNPRALMLLVSLSIFLGTLIFSFLVNLRQLHSPQIAEIGFIATMLLMNSKLNHELRASRDELMLSEARFRVLVEHAKDAIFLHDVAGRIADVNQQACTSLGYSRHELIGMNVMNIESAMTAIEAENIWQTMQTGETVTLEGRHRRKNGSEFPVEVRIGLFHGNDCDLALAIARDISERKQAEQALQASEQRLRATLDNTPGVAVQWYDRTGHVLYWNTASEKLYAIPASQAMGKSLQELLLTPEQFREFLASIALIEKQQTTFGPTEIDITSQQGARATVLYTMFMIPGTTEEPIFVCMDVNITERKRAEEALRQQQEHLEDLVKLRTQALEAANKELTTFSYSVSHDLRAPLQVINGFSHALHDDYADRLDDEGKHLLERIEFNTLRMARIIEDLLKLSHLNRADLKPMPVNFSAIAREIATQLREASPTRAVQIEIQPNMTPHCDAGLIKIALENLLANAWKYSAKNSQARIEFGCLKQNKQDVYFIRDNGAGFDMNYASNLFGPFQRMHHQNEFEGNGIGLATVQRIIHRHGGRIWAEAEPDKGATFFFTVGTLPTKQ